MEFEVNPNDTEIEFIKKSLQEYNDQIVGSDNHLMLNIVIKNDKKEIIGGLIGGTYWGWLYIDRFWISENYRRQGIGKKILKMAENEARIRGCKSVHLDTMSFQAVEFYKKQGYQTKCEYKDLPKGYSKFTLMKEL